MSTLFGLPSGVLLTVCVVGVVGLLVLVALLNARKPILARIALRNMLRRIPQSLLMIIGLALSTILISNALGVGDTLAYSTRQTAVRQLGPVDIEIGAASSDRYPMLTQGQADQVAATLQPISEISGAAPFVRRELAIVAPRSSQSIGNGLLYGLGSDYAQKIGSFATAEGANLGAADLAADEVLLNAYGATALRVVAGDTLTLYGATPTTVRIKAVVADEGLSTGRPAVVLPLEQAQAVLGAANQISAVAIRLNGAVDRDPGISQRAMAAIETALGNQPGLKPAPVKAQALAQADADGQLYMQIFLIMGTFAVLIGMLLIFLLFVMLAAERRSEMGMARAIGFKRRDLVLMFLTEGLLYQVVASTIGVVAGYALCRVMVEILAAAFEQVRDTSLARTILFSFSPLSMAIAFGLGFLLTAITVIFSAWRVSRMNIVEAIRDLPTAGGRASWLRLAWEFGRALLLLLFGLASVAGGYAGKTSSLVYLGISLALIGGGLLVSWVLARTPLRRTFGDRIAFTAGGLGILALWLVPGMNDILGVRGFAQGPEVFVFSGVFIIFGAIWAVVCNLDLLLGLINSVFSRVRSLVPVLKLAIAYPLVSKFRTGLALAMFSLIIFTVVMVSAITSTQGVIYEDHNAFTGGYQIYAQTSGESQVDDFKAAAGRAGINTNDLAGVSSVVQRPVAVEQAQQPTAISALYAMDGAYVTRASQFMRLVMRAPGYDDQAIWQALSSRDDVVLLTRLNVRSSTSPNSNPGGAYVVAGNVYIEDGKLPATRLTLRLDGSNSTREVEVLGVLDTYGIPMNGIFTNQQTMQGLVGAQLPPTAYLINTRSGADPVALTQQLQQAFRQQGLTAIAIDQQLDGLQSGDRLVFKLFKLFLAMGLLIGIAALGVISSRNVVERRQQIGMLRAIGYQRKQILRLFLIESSFIALLGLALGAVLGLILGANVTAEIAKSQPGVVFDPEWGQLLLILAGAYLFSLLTTFLPAQRAARVYPAEALRYE